MDDNELNRAVAEKIKNLVVVAGEFGLLFYRDDSVEPGLFSFGTKILPDYANSADACFGPGGVVEVMRGKGWDFMLSWEVPNKTSEGGPFAFFGQPGGAITAQVWVYGDSITRAVCLAALAAVEGAK